MVNYLDDTKKTIMKIAKYPLINGTEVEIGYNPDDPCRICGLPVIDASCGGVDICSACDMGYNRNGTKWDWIQYKQLLEIGKITPKKHIEYKEKDD